MSKRSPAITVALIGGVFAILAPILTYFVTKAGDTLIFQSITEDRRAAIEGHWNGSMEQEFRGHPLTYPGELELQVDGRTLRGKLHVTLKDAGDTLEATFNMTGGFLHDRFTRFEYASDAKGSVHFGSMILELSPTGKELSGYFVAFGAYSQKIVYGPIRFTKTE